VSDHRLAAVRAAPTLLCPPEDTRSSKVKIREGFATGGSGGASGDVGDTKKERFCRT
jgi:hypothetical protein